MKRHFWLLLGVGACTWIVILGMSAVATAAPDACGATSSRPSGTPSNTFIVNSDCDQPDKNPGDGECLTNRGACTFRAAIDEANAMAGANNIYFNFRRSGGGCPSSGMVINADKQYFSTLSDGKSAAYVVRDDRLTIDGYTQCGAAVNTGQVAGNAVIRVSLDGGINTSAGESAAGLVIGSDQNVIRGLSIYEFTRSVEFRDANYNTFAGNFVGMKPDGSQGYGDRAIRLNFGSTYNVIGGDTPAERNVIAGNGSEALDIQGTGVAYNHIIGNYMGVKQDGVTPLGNGADGVDIAEGAHHNWIGGIKLNAFGQPLLDANGNYIADPNKRNIIVNNEGDGVEISHGLDTQFNQIVGNWIGVDVAGNPQQNKMGVVFEDQVNHNYVYQNVIAGNRSNGVRFYTVFENYLMHNLIGVLPNGTPRPNGTSTTTNEGRSGVFLMGGSSDNVVQGNTIAYNNEYGVYINTEAGYLAYPNKGGYGSCDSWRNTISQNKMFSNVAQGIRLKEGACNFDNGNPIDNKTHYPNQGIAKPAITVVTNYVITGTTNGCVNCIVEAFLVAEPDTADSGRGEGKTYVGRGSTNASGAFVFSVEGVAVGANVTATVTDTAGNTSEFAFNKTAVAGSPPSDPPDDPGDPNDPPPPPAPTTTVPPVFLPLVTHSNI